MTLPPIHEERIYIIAGHPVGAILYGDTWAILPVEQKWTLLERGVVFLHPHSEWFDRLEPVSISGDERYGYGPQTFKGAVLDERVALFVRELKDMDDIESDERFAGRVEHMPDLWNDDEE